jgi:hypothetical protein
MGDILSREIWQGKQKGYQRRRERSSLPSSSPQAIHDERHPRGWRDDCPICKVESPGLRHHIKKQHPDHRQGPIPRLEVTPSDAPHIPFARGDSRRAARPRAPSSIRRPTPSPEPPGPAGARVITDSRNYVRVSGTPRNTSSRRPNVSPSERPVSPMPRVTVREFCRRRWENIRDRGTNDAGRDHPQRDIETSPPPSPSTSNQSFWTPNSTRPASREYHHRPASVEYLRVREDNRGHHHNRPEHYPSSRSSSRGSVESRRRQDSEPREESAHAHSRRRRPRRSESPSGRHRHPRGPSRTRVSDQPGVSPSWTSRHGSFRQRRRYSGRDRYAGHSRSQHRHERPRSYMDRHQADP